MVFSCYALTGLLWEAVNFFFSLGVPKLSKCVFKSLLLGLKMSFFLRKVIFWVLNVPKGGGVIDLGTIPQRRCLCLGRDSNGDAFAW